MSFHLPGILKIAATDTHDPNRFKVGTLSYTKAGLITLFLYLLWGDFCFSLMETVVPNILPLKLKAISAPNWALGLIMITIPNLMSATISPFINFRSDRFRSKWGRRIPFLAGATPFLVLFLILLGYSEPIGLWVQKVMLGGRFGTTPVLLVVIGLFMVCFQFFNLFVSSAYYCLFNDVVPHAFLARFMVNFRMVGVGAGAGYNYFVLKYANTHMQQIFLGAGLLYLVTFIVMCRKVKEGDYPPPSPNIGNKTGFMAAAKTYAVECFTHRFYWYIFLANACVAMGWVSGAYGLLYQTRYLSLDLSFVGKVNGICGIVGLLLLYPAGVLTDRIHPLRVLLFSSAVQVLVVGPMGILFAMARPIMSADAVALAFVSLCSLWLPFTALNGAAEPITMMRLFPMSRYGQFGSANGLIRSLALIVGGVLCGGYLDLVKKLNPSPDYCYRYLPFWNITWSAGYAFFIFLVYREWKKLGGTEHFVPPLSEAEENREASPLGNR